MFGQNWPNSKVHERNVFKTCRGPNDRHHLGLLTSVTYLSQKLKNKIKEKIQKITENSCVKIRNTLLIIVNQKKGNKCYVEDEEKLQWMYGKEN